MSNIASIPFSSADGGILPRPIGPRRRVLLPARRRPFSHSLSIAPASVDASRKIAIPEFVDVRIGVRSVVYALPHRVFAVSRSGNRVALHADQSGMEKQTWSALIQGARRLV